jgi:hypothetical protein
MNKPMRSIRFLLILLTALAFVQFSAESAQCARKSVKSAKSQKAKRAHAKKKKVVSFRKSVKKFQKYLKHSDEEARVYLSSDQRKRDVLSMRARDEIYLRQLWKLSSRTAKEICRETVGPGGGVSEPCMRAQTQKIDVGRILHEIRLARRGITAPEDLNRALASD